MPIQVDDLTKKGCEARGFALCFMSIYMRRAEDSDKRCTQVVHCGAHPGAAIMAATLRLSGPSARCHQWSP